ncbi:RNA pseudouridine synthase [Motiliproteus sp. MSK22-1]|nr:RNA pseudouridine synthase [Motiliproteus sp. MSK22-1]
MIEIIYADSQIVLINKPHDLLSVPGRGPNNQDSVLLRLQQQFPTIRIVHRLDCATSGVMVLALDADSHRALSIQFQERKTAKRYIARIYGQPNNDSGSVDLPLRCDWENRPKQMVDFEQGKSALTHWQVIEYSEDCTRVALTPVTGRSHQLRVHMLAMGHPIAGDRFYASGEALTAADRLHLHAESLELFHPLSGEKVCFTAPCPF